jgi:periplasmic divalent cation tolerance protein
MPFVYITCKDKKEGKKISRLLLEKRIIACANSFPIESSYWWKGKIVNDNEYAILAKTLKKNYAKIQKEVKKIHSYDIPCICMIDAKSNKQYDAWIRKEVK